VKRRVSLTTKSMPLHPKAPQAGDTVPIHRSVSRLRPEQGKLTSDSPSLAIKLVTVGSSCLDADQQFFPAACSCFQVLRDHWMKGLATHCSRLAPLRPSCLNLHHLFSYFFGLLMSQQQCARHRQALMSKTATAPVFMDQTGRGNILIT
jgi:hypothetical protein